MPLPAPCARNVLCRGETGCWGRPGGRQVRQEERQLRAEPPGESPLPLSSGLGAGEPGIWEFTRLLGCLPAQSRRRDPPQTPRTLPKKLHGSTAVASCPARVAAVTRVSPACTLHLRLTFPSRFRAALSLSPHLRCGIPPATSVQLAHTRARTRVRSEVGAGGLPHAWFGHIPLLLWLRGSCWSGEQRVLGGFWQPRSRAGAGCPLPGPPGQAGWGW